MPTYQYACTDCGHRFEQVQAFSDASLTDCPVCGGKLRKVYGSVGVVFKGSGFYRTDSRSGAAANAGEKSDAGSSASADSGKAAAKESGTTTTKSSDSARTVHQWVIVVRGLDQGIEQRLIRQAGRRGQVEQLSPDSTLGSSVLSTRPAAIHNLRQSVGGRRSTP